MAGIRYEFEAELYRWAARREKWVFARLPEDASAEIADQPHPPAGFNSVKVSVTLGGSRWSTSIFPDGSGYVVPIKAAVLRAEGIDLGDTVRIGVETQL